MNYGIKTCPSTNALLGEFIEHCTSVHWSSLVVKKVAFDAEM